MDVNSLSTMINISDGEIDSQFESTLRDIDLEEAGLEILKSSQQIALEASPPAALEAAVHEDVTPDVVAKVGGSELPEELLIPVKEQDGSEMFRLGAMKRRGPSSLTYHEPDVLSHPYLQTSEAGILHIVTGWSRTTLISDLSYRYKAGNSQTCSIPFLENASCDVRKYKCKGVYVCSKSNNSFRSTSHGNVTESNPTVKTNMINLSVESRMRRRAVEIYRELIGKKQYCHAKTFENRGKRSCLVLCAGKPVIRKRKSKVFYGSPFFVGCSGFQPGQDIRHAIRMLDDLDEPHTEYLRKLLSKEETPDEAGVDCVFVQGKRKRGERTGGKCEVDDSKLVHIPCKHEMTIIEPLQRKTDENIGTNENQDRKSLPPLYVACMGSHSHPPPPPPSHTLRKMQLLEEESKKSPGSSPARLRLRVESMLLEATDNGTPAPAGNPHIPAASSRRYLKKMRQKPSQLSLEAGLLIEMVGDIGNSYVRDLMVTSTGHYVVTLGKDELVIHASRVRFFAADATYRTVTPETRCESIGRWYLYNIVAPAKIDGGANSPGVVVFRALVTGLTEEVYRTIWNMFFKEIRSFQAMFCDEKLDNIALVVPYRRQEMLPQFLKNSVAVDSITMDFDTAEVKGCAKALVDVCGGTVVEHIENAFIGCLVHLDRDFQRRCRSDDCGGMLPLTKEERLATYRKFGGARGVEDATALLAQISDFDANWVAWMEKSGLKPMICRAFSYMSPSVRALGFGDTNIVESQNRRGNLYCGTHLRPEEAVKELAKLDTVDQVNLARGLFNRIRQARAPRKRLAHTLQPSGSRISTTKKRSRAGMGPVGKKAKMTVRAAGGAASSQDNIEVVSEESRSHHVSGPHLPVSTTRKVDLQRAGENHQPGKDAGTLRVKSLRTQVSSLLEKVIRERNYSSDVRSKAIEVCASLLYSIEDGMQSSAANKLILSHIQQLKDSDGTMDLVIDFLNIYKSDASLNESEAAATGTGGSTSGEDQV